MKTAMGILAALTVLAVAAAAWTGDGYKPSDQKVGIDWASVAIVVIALAAIGMLGFKSSRKTHQD